MKRRKFVKNSMLITYAFSNIDKSGINVRPTNITETRKSLGSEKIRLAVVQQDGNPGQVESNRIKAIEYAEEALNQNADVILFHEELLVGYVDNVHKLAENVNGPTSTAFQKLLQGTNSLIIYGLTEKDNNEYYISAPVVSASGVIANYRKTHLWWDAEGLRNEPSFYKPGNKLITFDVKGFKSGIMICYDGDFPEMARSYANLGCYMLFWLNNRGSRGYDEVKDLAYRNSIIIPTACCCGLNEMGNLCRGGSNITDANGELIEELWEREGIIFGDVYPGDVPKIRAKNPWYQGMRPDLYYYE
jgi:(R)-amidase